MNTYTTKFFAACPENGVRIEYTWTLTQLLPVRVEDLIERVGRIHIGHHEAIADDLFAEYGGNQTLSAHHHGVDILTERGG